MINVYEGVTCMNFRALLAIALLTMSSLAFSETRLPHIVILATGGTIAGSAASNTQTIL
ncbi:hypothetical protein NX009_21470 [Klebsiella pneumoniae]|nr:hypothetical protein [Klebsiella pneumoniae]